MPRVTRLVALAPPILLVVVVVVVVMVEGGGVLTTSLSSSGPHIADVNILLPPKMTYPVEYRLQVSDGCFKWTWDHHDILSVLPEYNATNYCSTSARLRSIAPFSGRKETALYATDVHTGIVLRCKVFIDNVLRIQIFHNSIKLDLDGLATLRVRAFDSEDNVFSSLVGVQFLWRLMPEADGSPHHLAHIPLKDSPLSDCGGLCGDLNIQIKLEENGVFSDLFVVKGTGIGHESVSVQLLESEFTHMVDKIGLTVAEAMSLEPSSPVFVLINAKLQYVLKVIRGNIPQVVTLPSPHHTWSVSNSSIAEVDSSLGFTHALSLGRTDIIVEDTRVAGHIQVSSLYVVLPDTLSLYLMPLPISSDPLAVEVIPTLTKWYLVSGREYLVQVKVFNGGPDAREIYITESDDLKFHDKGSRYWSILSPPDDILVIHGRKNSRILRVISQGHEKLTASLTYFAAYKGAKEVLEAVQDITVCDQVKFVLIGKNDMPQKILLPWAPDVYQEVKLNAAGGCAKAPSDYKWYSSDLTTVSISASGVVQARMPGKVTIKVVSIYDARNFDEVVVEVSIPSTMIMMKNFPVETVLGSHLQAAVTMKALNGAYFYRCDAFHQHVKWKTGGGVFIVANATEEAVVLGKLENVNLHGPPCSWTRAYASGSGRSVLHATLSKEHHHSNHSTHESIFLKASVAVAAYPPLTVHQLGDGNQFGGYWFDFALAKASNQLEELERLYLVPGTSVDVILSGGPEQWDKKVDYIETVEILDDNHVNIKDGVQVHQASGSYQSIYRVLCPSIGTFELIFKRGNLIGDDHPLPAVAEALLSLTCSLPSSIVLIVDELVNRDEVIRAAALVERGRGQVRETTVVVANGRTIRLAAVGIDFSGEAFANSSSLCLKWELSKCEQQLAHWADAFETRESKSTWERFLVLQNESGECIVRATAIGFSETGPRQYAENFQSLEHPLTDAVHLQLVSALRVHPEFNLLYFNPSAQLNLSVHGGSCFLEAVVNNSQVLEVLQPPPGLQCSQLTLSPKALGTALVTIYDIGLVPPMAASAVVLVADIEWIEIVSDKEISLMEGQTHSIDIMAGIKSGDSFGLDQYAFMEIHVCIEDQIVELLGSKDVLDSGCACVNSPNFQIVAKHLGITMLYVSARQQSGQEMRSQLTKVEVYAPLTLHPHDVFLVPGASYVLAVKGGPSIGAYIEYASLDDGVATIDKSSGHLSAISPGNTTIVSMAFRKGDVVICQAYCSIKIGVPTLAILNVQSQQLDIGRLIPIYPSFVEGDLFSFYEQCKSYEWTVADEKVLSFYKPEKLNGEKRWFTSDDEKELEFMKVLYGRSAGSTYVAVSFSCDFSSASYSQSRVYNTSVSLLVMPDLPLALAVPITWVLPPHYVTSDVLPPSIESHDQWDNESPKRTITYSLLRSCGGKYEGWPKDTLSIEGNRIKTAESGSLACIEAKDQTTGKIEIAACVRVTEVAQIRMTMESPRVTHLGVGGEIDLPISYFDALGNPFYEAHDFMPYDAETNRHDIVSVSVRKNGSDTIHLKAMRHGRALVRVSIQSHIAKSDYMLVSIGAHVYPQNPVLHQGSSLTFYVEGISDQLSGHWHSANASVISMDLPSGIAKAVGIGSTQVFFECSSIKLQTSVTVLSGNIVSIDAPKEILTNVPYPMKGFSFAVRFSDAPGKYEITRNSKGLSYECNVDPALVGYAKPWMDLDTGNFYCLFFPYSPEHLVGSAPKLKDMRPYISVSINASLKEANHDSGSASALFIGGFSILEMDKSLMQLNLTPDSNRTVLTILGNTDVEFHWNEKEAIQISSIQKEDFGIASWAQYEVKVVKAKRLKDKIIVTLPANGQRVEIDVSYEPGATAASKAIRFLDYVKSILIGLLTLLMFTMFSMLLVERMSIRLRRSTPPAAPISAEPRTPEQRSSAPIFSERSPQTPQPFVDYVRRTIDETPYYKRDARRRFNPQNTY